MVVTKRNKLGVGIADPILHTIYLREDREGDTMQPPRVFREYLANESVKRNETDYLYLTFDPF